MNSSTTAKRLLRSVAMLSIVAVGSSAYATFTYTDDFESYTKAQPIVGEASGDGLIWSGDAADLSSVLATNYTFTDATHPITPGAHTNVLELSTEGTTLTNAPTTTISDNGVIYVDQMVNLVASESAPAGVLSDTSIQTAVYVDVNSNLWAVITDHTAATNKWLALDQQVEPGTWARMTIVVDYSIPSPLQNVAAFKILLNEVDLTSTSDGYSEPTVAKITDSAPDGGAWFVSANASASFNTLSSVGYQGTGLIDDLVITDEDPFSTAIFYEISTIISGDGTADPADVPIVVAAGTGGNVTYAVTDTAWDVIASLYSDGVEVTAAAGQTSYVWTYSNIGADISNNVTFATSAFAYDGKTPSAWAKALGAANVANEDGDLYDLFNEYLINTDPTVSNLFEIVELGFTGAKPYVKYEALGLPGGTLVVSNTADLVNGPWTALDGALDDSVPGEVKWTGTLDASAGDALKIVVTE